MSLTLPKITVSSAFVSEELAADIVVVGAGVAGLCAALAASRCGARVILVTDRPVLGGSASSEVGVGICGAASSPFNLWARETGIVEEIRNRHAACWNGDAESYWTAMDRVYLDMVLGEPRLRLLLNTTILALQAAAVQKGDTKAASAPPIVAIQGVQLRAEKTYTLTARFFIDCSGDGVLGNLAGADSRCGREARAEFHESMAPEAADSRTMGATLLWRSRDAGKPVSFHAPAWAVDVNKLPAFARPGSDPSRDVGRTCVGCFQGLWWAEFGGQEDSIHDDQDVLLHTRALVYGIWDWIKNSGKVANVANQELVHVAALSGKRESRRLLGPVILTENHWRRQARFEDAVCHGGWPIDVHPPLGYLDPAPACTHVWLPGPSDIPLRALYSRNVPNLFFAGRCISVTHIGLGSPRVQATTAVCGQAVGVAAAMCLRENTTPGKLAPPQVAALQQRLVRMDQVIIGRALHDPLDLASLAEITASSTRNMEQLEGECLLALDPQSMPDLANAVDHVPGRWYSGSNGVLVAIPADQPLDHIELKFQGREGRELEARIFFADRPENYRRHTPVGVCKARLDAEGWARIAVGRPPNEGKKFLVFFPPQSDLALRVAPVCTPGIVAARVWATPPGSLAAEPEELSRLVNTPCFRAAPRQDLFAAANVADGYIGPHGLPHQWCSAPMEPGRPETLTLDWPDPVRMAQVELVFDTQLNGESRSGVAAALVRDYELVADVDGKPVTLVRTTGNTRRFVIHHFAPVQTRRLELRINATHGAPCAAVYAVRVYAGSR